MHQKPMVFSESMSANVSLVGHLFSSTCLAFSLPQLHTTVTLTSHKGSKDTWKISSTERLSYQSIDRYLKHLQRVKQALGFDGGFFVQSNNNFPMGIGLASSYSSYSALTLCAVKAICALQHRDVTEISQAEMAALSAQGKFSSQHAFYTPWSIVENNSLTGASFGAFDQLSHVALVVCNSQKRITIEQVLALIAQNPKSADYHTHVRQRVAAAHTHIAAQDWKALFHCVWEDFIELHAIFHSSKPSFSFQSEATRQLLEQVKRWWDIYDDGPIVVMGIGYVVHLLFRPDQVKMQEKMLATLEFYHCLPGTYQAVPASATGV